MIYSLSGLAVLEDYGFRKEGTSTQCKLFRNCIGIVDKPC